AAITRICSRRAACIASSSPPDERMSISPEEIAWLKKHFGDECKELRVEGDEPLLLDDPSRAFVTQVAQHQLFCVAYANRAPVGRREHVALCGAGQLLFALSPERAGA